MDKLTVTLIANAGVLLEFRGTTLLVDGIFRDDRFFFSSPSPDVWAQMLAGGGIFRKVDYLLVTHAHPDHFSADMMRQYLAARPVKGVFLPAAVTPAEQALAQDMRRAHISFVPLIPGAECGRRFQDISVHAFPTRHLDKVFWDVPHFCYLVSFAGKRVLITADTDYTGETFSFLQGVPLQAVLLNPLFFHALHDPRHFRGQLTARTFCVYHVPAGDNMQLRTLAERDTACWPKEEGRVVLLCEPMQTAEL